MSRLRRQDSNARNAATFESEDMTPLVPGKANLIVTRMDPRLDLEQSCEIQLLSGMAVAPLKKLYVALQMGTRNIAVIHHTDPFHHSGNSVSHPAGSSNRKSLGQET
ncbi:hypothetical protein C8J56DRAFT_1043778 [Mycena floridula]|nr:hypothetical protein C8J56DRAFT_1043778 [Mycena floridula]